MTSCNLEMSAHKDSATSMLLVNTLKQWVKTEHISDCHNSIGNIIWFRASTAPAVRESSSRLTMYCLIFPGTSCSRQRTAQYTVTWGYGGRRKSLGIASVSREQMKMQQSSLESVWLITWVMTRRSGPVERSTHTHWDPLSISLSLCQPVFQSCVHSFPRWALVNSRTLGNRLPFDMCSRVIFTLHKDLSLIVRSHYFHWVRPVTLI